MIDFLFFFFFSMNCYTFKDSLSFMPNSLDALVKDLKFRKPDHKFSLIAQSEICLDKNGEFDQQRFDTLIDGKSCLPYDMINSAQILLETKCIPEREQYYNKLKESELSIEDYENLKNFFDVFNCQREHSHIM